MLENLKIIENLSQNDKEALELFCQERYVKSGEILFNEGDEANAMYFLKKGAISIYKTIKGQKVVLGKVVAEEIIGEMALFGEIGIRMGTAEAIEDSELITVASFSIKELTSKNQELLTKIQNIIKERKMNNQIIESKINNT